MFRDLSIRTSTIPLIVTLASPLLAAIVCPFVIYQLINNWANQIWCCSSCYYKYINSKCPLIIVTNDYPNKNAEQNATIVHFKCEHTHLRPDPTIISIISSFSAVIKNNAVSLTILLSMSIYISWYLSTHSYTHTRTHKYIHTYIVLFSDLSLLYLRFLLSRSFWYSMYQCRRNKCSYWTYISLCYYVVFMYLSVITATDIAG